MEEVGTEHDLAYKISCEEHRYSLTAYFDRNKVGQYVYQGRRNDSSIPDAVTGLLLMKAFEKVRMQGEEVLLEETFGNENCLYMTEKAFELIIELEEDGKK